MDFLNVNSTLRTTTLNYVVIPICKVSEGFIKLFASIFKLANFTSSSLKGKVQKNPPPPTTRVLDNATTEPPIHKVNVSDEEIQEAMRTLVQQGITELMEIVSQLQGASSIEEEQQQALLNIVDKWKSKLKNPDIKVATNYDALIELLETITNKINKLPTIQVRQEGIRKANMLIRETNRLNLLIRKKGPISSGILQQFEEVKLKIEQFIGGLSGANRDWAELKFYEKDENALEPHLMRNFEKALTEAKTLIRN